MKEVIALIWGAVAVLLACLMAIVFDRSIITLFVVVSGGAPRSFLDSMIIRAVELGLLSILWFSGSMSTATFKGSFFKELALGFSLAFLGFLGIYCTDLICSAAFGQGPLDWFRQPVSSEPLWAVVGFGVILGPWVEEFFFRAYLWRWIDAQDLKVFSKWTLASWAVLIFAALHLSWSLPFSQQWMMFVAWCCCGALGMFLLVWRNSIVAPLCVHGLANGVMLLPLA